MKRRYKMGDFLLKFIVIPLLYIFVVYMFIKSINNLIKGDK